jgi:hypothetical protein
MSDREQIVQDVAKTLGIDAGKGEQVVCAFERFVAEPLSGNLAAMTVSAVAARNPFVYAALGSAAVGVWVDKVVADKLTSNAEGFIGNFLEEVARILSGGTKPGSGVDLQIDRADDEVDLYAIQSTTNTKNAGGKRSDLDSLEKAAGALRAQRRHVNKHVAFLFGRKKTTVIRGVTNLASVEFWQRISGQQDILPKLLRCCVTLSPLYLERVTADVDELKKEVARVYSDASGNILYEELFRIGPRKRAK